MSFWANSDKMEIEVERPRRPRVRHWRRWGAAVVLVVWGGIWHWTQPDLQLSGQYSGRLGEDRLELHLQQIGREVEGTCSRSRGYRGFPGKIRGHVRGSSFQLRAVFEQGHPMIFSGGARDDNHQKFLDSGFRLYGTAHDEGSSGSVDFLVKKE